MDLLEKWLCWKNGFAGKMDLPEKWICLKNGFSGKMDFLEKWIFWKNGFSGKWIFWKMDFLEKSPSSINIDTNRIEVYVEGQYVQLRLFT
jgi:hypothetical protein